MTVQLALLVLISTLSLSVYVFYRYKYQYWKRKNLPHLQPRFPFGNVSNPLSLNEKPGYTVTRLYREMKRRKWKHGGFYFLATPVYLAIDLDLVKTILAKDFEYFVDRGAYHNEKYEPLAGNLLLLGGQKWKKMRTILNPTFSPGKIKMMIPIFKHCTKNMVKKIEEQCRRNGMSDIYKILTYFGIDNIGACAFGIECNTLEEEERSPYKIHASRITLMPFFKFLLVLLLSLYPKIVRKLGITTYPKESSDFFLNITAGVIKYREENQVVRQDLMQMLINLENTGNLTFEQIAAQCFIFFIAGYETSATTMTMAMYEMAKNQEIQEKVRNEINTVMGKHFDESTYESIRDLKYMSQVIDETMRKYPVVLYLTRKCVKDYEVPGENTVIEKGTTIVIPTHAIHYDEEYYPDPDTFDPERFNETNKSRRHNYSHLPFGEGPRICIGRRFALLQIKLGLAALLKNFRFTLNEKTEEPLTMKVTSLVVTPASPIWLNVYKL